MAKSTKTPPMKGEPKMKGKKQMPTPLEPQKGCEKCGSGKMKTTKKK